MIDIIASLVISQVDQYQCSGLAPDRDITEIHKISERILGKDNPIMFVVFGKTQPSEDAPVIIFCFGADTSTIEKNPNYQHIEIFNQEIDLYLKIH